MKIKIITALGAALVAASGIWMMSCGEIKRGEYAKGSATIFCDDGFRKILEEEIGVFEYSYPES